MDENGQEDVYMFERQHLYVQVYRTSIWQYFDHAPHWIHINSFEKRSDLKFYLIVGWVVHCISDLAKLWTATETDKY